MEDRSKTVEDIIICQDVHKWFGDFHVLRGVALRVQGNPPLFGPSTVWRSTKKVTLS
jgi:general L-amino acid transport system ATP-binding protein